MTEKYIPNQNELTINPQTVYPRRYMEGNKDGPEIPSIGSIKPLSERLPQNTPVADTNPDTRQALRVLRELDQIKPVGGGQEIKLTDFLADPKILAVANQIKQAVNLNKANSDFLQKQITRVEQLIDRGANQQAANILLDHLTTLQQQAHQAEMEKAEEISAEQKKAREEHAKYSGYTLYLQEEELRLLEESPLKWLDQQFDILYKMAQEGQELSSPVANNIQTAISAAVRFLQNNSKNHNQIEAFERFQNVYVNRFNNLAMRTVIGLRNMGAIKERAASLQTHGLFQGFSMESGKVNAMLSRLHELTEDQRLASPDHHLTPEQIYKLQTEVINEQLEQAKKGVGFFGSETFSLEEEKIKADITRAVRTAYDLFINSQRQAVIVARGRHLSGSSAYFSDPSSGPLNVYNLENLLTEKFDIFNTHDYEFLKRIKLELAEGDIVQQKERLSKLHEELRQEEDKKKKEEIKKKIETQEEIIRRASTLDEAGKLDRGTKLFRDLFAVPDFFSSGWRIEGILGSIEERFVALARSKGISVDLTPEEVEKKAKEKARDFALFMRLKQASPEGREDIWGKIAKYRPEEILRLFREKEPEKLNALFEDEIFKKLSLKNYDEFKKKFGPVIRLLRDRGFQELRQINIGDGGFTEEDKEVIKKFLDKDKPEDIQKMYRKMSDFSSKLIPDLSYDPLYQDIYARTILIDDALLDKLEDSHLEGTDKEFTPLSKKYAADQGGDAYVRVWNDTENAVKASGALIGFIKAEEADHKFKSALEFAEANSQYNGQDARAKSVRYTIGTFLELSKANFIWDLLGVSKLPFRKPMSEIEKIYGAQAKPVTRDELRKMLDKFHLVLVGSIDKNIRSGEKAIEAHLKLERAKAKLLEAQGKNSENDIKTAEEALQKTQNGVNGIEKEAKEAEEKAEKMYKDLEKIFEVTKNDKVKMTMLRFLVMLLLGITVEIYVTTKTSIYDKK